MIIVFSGTDGAGKSTQIEKLTDYYAESGKVVCHLWARGGYTPGFSGLKKLLRLFAGKKLPGAGVSDSRNQILKKKSVSNAWLSLAILDLILFYAVYARGLSWLGRVVICDRYIEDTFLDFTHNFGCSFKANGFLWKLLIFLAPNPDHAFLLTVPVDVSLYRSTLKNEPFPDTPETLEWRLKMYMDEVIFPSNRFCKVDCQQPVDDIQKIIQDHLSKEA